MAENRSVNIVNGSLIINQAGIPASIIEKHQMVVAGATYTSPNIDYKALERNLSTIQPQNFCELIDKNAVDRLAEMGINHGNMQLPSKEMAYENLQAPTSELSEPVVPMTFGSAPELSC